MDEESQWIDRIEKYVFEDEKVVTCKWLSRQLDIHVNVSKRLLSKFIEKSDEVLGVCYIVGGVMPDGSHKVLVGRRQDIASIKSLFKIVTSEHVYSVQKSSTNEDLKLALYSANNCVVKDNGTKPGVSAIRCEESIVKSVTAIKRNDYANQQNKSADSNIKTNASNASKQTNGSVKENLTKSNVISNGSDTNGVKKSQSGSSKKTGLAAMFANQKDTKKPDNMDKVLKPSVKNKPKGLAAFFNQSNENKKCEKSNKNDEQVIDNSKGKEEKSNLSDIDNKDNENPKENCKSAKSIENSKESSPSADNCNNSKTKSSDKSNKLKRSQKAGKKRKKDKDEDTRSKKRKRILMMSDSESNDEDQRERSPSPPPREPTPPPPMSDDEDIVPTTPQVGKKAKKKKLVEKTFLDEDGFLVTHKEYVLASSSEDERGDPSEKKDAVPSATQKSPQEEQNDKATKSEEPKSKIQESQKKTSPQKVKQSSIMNFFGKKS